MHIALISKACLVGIYQRKLEELAALRDVELTVIVPPFWRDERGTITLERQHVDGYQLIVEKMRFNGSFHMHYYPDVARQLDALRPEEQAAAAGNPTRHGKRCANPYAADVFIKETNG